MPEKNPETERGLKCPKCGMEEYETYFGVHINLTHPYFLLKNDGTLLNCSAMEWDESSACECSNCGHKATVADFRVKSVRQMLLEACELIVDSQNNDDLNTAVLVNQVLDMGFEAAEAAIKAANQRGLDA